MRYLPSLLGGLLGLAALSVCAMGVAAAAQERRLDGVIADLAKGGAVIVMRHANSPAGQIGSVGLTAGCVLEEGRGLDAKGLFQAQFIGEFLKSEGVVIGAAYTSDLCRSWDTARLVAAGSPVGPVPALKSTNIADLDVFKAAIAVLSAEKPAETILLVTHSNIAPLLTDWGGPEEIPSGVILIVDPKTWTIKEKLNLDVDMTVSEE